MPNHHYRSASLLAATGLIAGLAAAPMPAAAQDPVAQYSAVAVNMLSNTPGSGATPLNIVVTRWSTEAEREQLLTTLMEQGEEALLKVLQKMPAVGSVAPTGGVGFNIHYASSTKQPDGTERVVLLTDRPMSFWERSNAGRTTDYPFTLIEIRLQPNGRGEGKASVATRVMADTVNKTIVLESWNDQPVTLTNVRRMD